MAQQLLTPGSRQHHTQGHQVSWEVSQWKDLFRPLATYSPSLTFHRTSDYSLLWNLFIFASSAGFWYQNLVLFYVNCCANQ